jgi:putative spermidine/putrescine transport system permease protein
MALLSPLVIPLVVLGIALLQFLSRLGLAKTFTSLLLGHLVITMPYVVRTLLAALSGFNRSIEEAALNLGANPAKVLWYVTLPNLRSGFLAAAIFAFITSFGDISISIFLAGGRNATLPVRLFQFVQYAYDPTITAVSTVIIVLTMTLIVTLDWVMGLERLV